MSAFQEAETLLAIDVGSVNTRASLFDVVDGRYRLVATGRSATTAGAPLFDVSRRSSAGARAPFRRDRPPARG